MSRSFSHYRRKFRETVDKGAGVIPCGHDRREPATEHTVNEVDHIDEHLKDRTVGVASIVLTACKSARLCSSSLRPCPRCGHVRGLSTRDVMVWSGRSALSCSCRSQSVSFPPQRGGPLESQFERSSYAEGSYRMVPNN